MVNVVVYMVNQIVLYVKRQSRLPAAEREARAGDGPQGRGGRRPALGDAAGGLPDRVRDRCRGGLHEAQLHDLSQS